jgi:DNA-binding transcriptional ArsR family regulator
MGITKSENFSAQQNEIALIAKALGHPARVAIIDYLLKVNTCICGDIVNELPLAQATISQHLKELKNAGIIHGEIEGNAICYCLNIKAIEYLVVYYSQIANLFKEKNSKCC